jgi:hypothetical protein
MLRTFFKSITDRGKNEEGAMFEALSARNLAEAVYGKEISIQRPFDV